MENIILGAVIALGAWVAYRALVANGHPDDSKPILRRGDRLVVVGDSLGVGLRRPIVGFAESDGVLADYHAEVNKMTAYWAARLPDLSGAAALLVVLGTNDAAGSGQSFERARDQILDAAEAAGVKVVWATPTGPHLPAAGLVHQKIMEAYIDERIDLLVPPPPIGPEYAKDHIHLSPAGYNRWAANIWKELTL